MKHCIFLCTDQWKIHKILHTSPDFLLSEGQFLPDLTADPDPLLSLEAPDTRLVTSVLLKFSSQQEEHPAVICGYPGYYLVFLACVTNEQDYRELSGYIAESCAYAARTLQPLFDDGYFRIQQINNQLINTQRALMKSNQQLKQTLNEISATNSLIALFERDELTGLYRTQAFYRLVRQKLAQNPTADFDIIALDLDRFKLINEFFGRKAGDRLLQSLALFLIGLDQEEFGLIARASADTFYLFMPSQLQFHQILCQKLPPFLQEYPLPFQITAKIGVCAIEDPAVPVEQVCDRARLALDTASARGSFQPEFYNQSIHEELVLEHQLLDSIPSALENREFQLYLQQKTDMASGEIIGAEALIRWQHPTLGMVAPNRFIPLLERDGSIYQVDQYIWEEACRTLARCQELGLKKIPISVNMARGDLYQKDLVSVLTGLIRTYHLDARDLHLEVLERSYVNDSSHIFRVLEQLRGCGFLIEMDDFGTGESSLAMLAEMPVDVLKLDRQFLISSFRDKRQTEIIRFIINLSKTLQISTIAEGVETREQEQLLLSMGCRYAQGYLYGRPVPANELLDRLKQA